MYCVRGGRDDRFSPIPRGRLGQPAGDARHGLFHQFAGTRAAKPLLDLADLCGDGAGVDQHRPGAPRQVPGTRPASISYKAWWRLWV